MATRIGRPADVLKQNEDSAHGGDGWVPRTGSMTDELGSIWFDCGVTIRSSPKVPAHAKLFALRWKWKPLHDPV